MNRIFSFLLLFAFFLVNQAHALPCVQMDSNFTKTVAAHQHCHENMSAPTSKTAPSAPCKDCAQLDCALLAQTQDRVFSSLSTKELSKNLQYLHNAEIRFGNYLNYDCLHKARIFSEEIQTEHIRAYPHVNKIHVLRI